MLERLRQLNPEAPLGRVIYYSTLWVFARTVMSMLYDFRVYGHHHIPPRGPVVVIANHQSYLDPPLTGIACRRHLHSLARSSLFRHPALRAAIESVNAIPVSGNQSDTAVFKLCQRHLDLGRMVLVYPEGQRSGDGTVQPFKRGVLLLLRRSRAPVLPMAIEGSFDNWSRHEKRPSIRGPIQINIGPLIPSETVLAMQPDEALAMLRDRVDCLRLDLRAKIRTQTRGRFPPSGPADRHHRDRETTDAWG